MLSEKLQSFVSPIVEHCETQFPKECSCCHKVFKNFGEFIKFTTPIGKAPTNMRSISVDDSFGILSFANCDCKSTLVIRCEDTKSEMHRIFRESVIEEANTTGSSTDAVLSELRDLIRNKVCAS